MKLKSLNSSLKNKIFKTYKEGVIKNGAINANKNSTDNNIKADKLNYKIRVISSNVSIDRFYNDTDPISVIDDLIKISSPQYNEKTIFIWPEGILPEISKADASSPVKL